MSNVNFRRDLTDKSLFRLGRRAEMAEEFPMDKDRMDKDRLVLELRLAEIERTLVMLASETGLIDVLADMLELRRHVEVEKGVPAGAFTLLKLVQKTPRPTGHPVPAELAPPPDRTVT